jgi:hypothetical protein
MGCHILVIAEFLTDSVSTLRNTIRLSTFSPYPAFFLMFRTWNTTFACGAELRRIHNQVPADLTCTLTAVPPSHIYVRMNSKLKSSMIVVKAQFLNVVWKCLLWESVFGILHEAHLTRQINDTCCATSMNRLDRNLLLCIVGAPRKMVRTTDSQHNAKKRSVYIHCWQGATSEWGLPPFATGSSHLSGLNVATGHLSSADVDFNPSNVVIYKQVGNINLDRLGNLWN